MGAESDIAGAHLSFYEALYDELNPQQLPEVDGHTVAQFLKRSGLGVLQLSQIWELSDRHKNGSLDKLGVFSAFKLIAAVQQDKLISANVLNDSTLDPPDFQRGTQPAPPRPPSLSSFSADDAVNTVTTRSASAAGLPMTDIGVDSKYRPQRSASVISKTSLVGDWEIDSIEQNKYETIFYSLKPVNGRLSGDQCREVLLNSRLSALQLARIWELADVDRDGHLDKYEMCIALHLVCRCLHGEQPPEHLPASLVHPMKRVQCGISAQRSLSTSPSVTVFKTTASSASIPPKIAQNSRTSSVTSLTKSSLNTSESAHNMCSIFDPKHADAAAAWPVGASVYEDLFRRLDTDRDGFVSGADVRTYAISFGLGQAILAHTWSLVDTAMCGRLNLEQFALWNELLKECQKGIQLPEHLPPHLMPPSLRGRGMASRVSSSGNSMSNVSISSESGGTAAIAAAVAENPRIQLLNQEIETAMENRRKAEQDLFQLEADTLVKNSEVKNLELELQTLITTVRQLQHQKTEAGKRLQDLDSKIVKLEGVCAEHTARIVAEEERLQRVKTEIAQANDNFNAEENILKDLRTEVVAADEKLMISKQTLADENAKIEQFVDELTMMERHGDVNMTEIARVEKLATELAELMEKWEEKKDRTSNDEEILQQSFQRITLETNDLICHNFGTPSKAMFPAFVADPFKDDPFGGSDDAPKFDADPFPASVLAEKDPFASTNAKTFGSLSGTEFADFSKFAAFE